MCALIAGLAIVAGGAAIWRALYRQRLGRYQHIAELEQAAARQRQRAAAIERDYPQQANWHRLQAHHVDQQIRLLRGYTID